MPIDFTCPYCGQRTAVAKEYAGTSGPCAGCGQQITIPSLGAVPNMSPAPLPPKSSSSGSGWSVVLIVAAASIVPLIACAGILVALLLPAIQAAREAARRAQCTNNLRQITIGLHNYHDVYARLPAGVNHAGLRGESERLGPSWWVGVLPFVESQPAYDYLDSLQRPGAPGNGAFNAQNVMAHAPDVRLDGTALPYMQCPSSPLLGPKVPSGPVALPSYVGISGGCDLNPDSSDYLSGSTVLQIPRPSASVPYQNREKAAGHVPGGVITASGLLTPCQYLRFASCKDGTSTTMIIGEQSDWLRDTNPRVTAKYHGDPGWDTRGTGPPRASTTDGGGFLSGTVQSTPVPALTAGESGSPRLVYDCYNITTVRYPLNFKDVLGATAFPGCSEDHGINNPLQSAHPGVSMVAMADGSVRFISETVELGLLLKLAIRDDGQAIRSF